MGAFETPCKAADLIEQLSPSGTSENVYQWSQILRQEVSV